MRVRDHIAISTTLAVLLAPRLGGSVLTPWAAAVLLDADHYLWYCLRQRTLSPTAAMRYFNEAQPSQHGATRVLHSPAVVVPLVALAARRRGVRPAAAAVILHIGLDAFHRLRLRGARRAALQRDGWTCTVCGRQSSDVVAHLARQPRLLPSYRADRFVSLCGGCHEEAHRGNAMKGTRALAGVG